MAGFELQSGATNKSATLTHCNESESGKAAEYCTCPSLAHANEEKSQLKERTATRTTTTNNYKQQHHLTILLMVIMGFIVIMPHNVDAAAVRRHLTATYGSDATGKAEKLLLLSEAIEELAEEYVREEKELNLESEEPQSSDYSYSDSETYDELSPIDVVRHAERKSEYQKSRNGKLNKRQAQHLDNLKYFDGTSKHNVWQNPCNVMGENPAVDVTHSRRHTYYLLKRFRETIRKEYVTRHLSLKHIKLDDMNSWSLHRDYYTFLPKVKQNSSITLSRWYSNMQIFVASFGYLGRSQYQWDMARQQYVSETTKELDQLLTSARLMLCELEFTINGSHANANTRKLKSFSTEAMDKKLQFQVKEQQNHGNSVVEPTLLDLKFAKDAYFKYLAGMRKVLKRKVSKNLSNSVKLESSEMASAENPSNGNDESQSSVNLSSMMRPDSNMSLGESFELSMKAQTTAKPVQQKKRRRQRQNNSNKQTSA
ncbi:uncharacterized protein LOC131801873 [Musca domestica]|uniref:Uncharacterized protein LOC131801873 n=1 Tax=Musca domestica TaxID=7370 RepID=A0A1I8MEZ1_MUSDO|nr:uncharacterized protein LOC131801873 [Musca domestica]